MNPLDCTDIKVLLSGLIDDELDPERRHFAERHIAQCNACRDLVNETEAMNELIVLDAQRLSGCVSSLPPGFEAAVLRQTVYAEAYQFAGRRWTSWLGWLAAAACLGLAVSIWFIDRQLAAPTPGNALAMEMNPANANRAVYRTTGRSWTFDGEVSPDELKLPALEDAAPSSHGTYASRPAGHAPAANSPAAAMPISASDHADSADSNMVDLTSITRDDADALYAASTLMSMLDHAELHSFAHADRIREIAEYDQLVQRLGDLRMRLPAQDRAVVLAAESVLLQLVQGPLDLNDLRVLRDTAASLKLADELANINARWHAASSL